MFCTHCGSQMAEDVKFCGNCGAPAAQAQPEPEPQPQPQPEPQPIYETPYSTNPTNPVYQTSYDTNPIVPLGSKSKIAAGLLALFLGSIGIHKFYLGYTKQGVIMLLIVILTFGIGACVTGIIAFIEGILYLTKTDYDFYQQYELNKKPWF